MKWRRAGALCLAAVITGPTSASAQSAEIAASVISAMTSLNAGDVAAYLSHFSPEARVLISYGESIELDAAGLGIRLDDLSWTPEQIDTRILGSMAITVLRLDGSLRALRGTESSGPWRYAETRVRSGGAWRIVQVELSPVEPASSARFGADAAVVPAPASRAAGAATDQPEVGSVPPGAPPAPRWPEVITRDDAGNVTARAVRLDRALDVDGRLDEPIYAQVPPVTGFVQSVPDEGQPASEETEAWVMFDDDNVFVSAKVYDRAPESEWVANEMRRDQIRTNDNFGLIFDTYYDRRNGYFFYANPLGGFSDIQVTNESSPNFEWNPVWDVRTGRFDGGWTVEMRFPFKSLRYRRGTSQVWGLQLRRAVRRRNEVSHLTPIPRSAAGNLGSNAIMRLSRAATLVGIEAPPPGVNIDVKGYGTASLTTDRAIGISDELDGDGGVDLKWGITQNLAADFTYNTDFAQVEVDEQQVNLTRFSLVFPEKREFFLESRGIFDFPTNGGGGRGGSAPQLFYSRRIGILGRTPVPILGGGRLTGKVGPLDVGALNIVTDDVGDIGAEMTDFTVLRLRGDILRRSNLGALYTRRSRSLVSVGASETYGADASFSFFEDLYLSGYFARSRIPGIDSLDVSYQGRMSYDGDQAGFSAGHLLVEDEFNPEVGLVRRSGFRQSQASVRLSPRPDFIESVRQVTLQGSVDYLENAEAGHVESRDIGGSLGIELENSDQISVDYSRSYENLIDDENISGAAIPAGRYSFDAVQVSYAFGPQRFFSGSLNGRYGAWYDGHLTSAGFSRGRVEVTPKLSLEPSVSFNRVEVPAEDFDTWLAVTRVNYTFSPRMFVSALVQYNSSNDSFSANARLRWEYSPGSEIFLVYTEERNTYDFERFPVLQNRGLVVKVTRLLRF